MYRSCSGISLDIVVVGGGIAGISTAYTLTKVGHRVTIIDKNNGNPKIPRAIRCGPNMTKTLRRWGLKSTLDRIAQPCSRIDWYSGTSQDLLGSMILGEDFFRELGAEFLLMEQADLLIALKELAIKAGVTFRLNSHVISVDSETGSVLLHTGEKLYGDVIIAADGYNSVLRTVVTGEEEEAAEGKYIILSFTIPASILMEDKELNLLADLSVWTFWIGEGYVIQANAVNRGRDYTVTIQHRHSGVLEAPPQGSWKEIGPAIIESGFDLNKIDLRARRLLTYAMTISSSLVFARSPVENLICENSRIVLVGEAAHPALPGVHHSQALSIEDAETLGSLFSRIQRKDQVSQLLTAYNEIRQPWCKFALEHLYGNQAILQAEQGPFQKARDAKIRAMLVQIAGEHMDEALFREIWGNELILFAYNAEEMVEDWWSQYGSFIVRSPQRDTILSFVAVSVSRDIE